MRIINVEVPNYYTCQNCGRVYQSKQDEFIEVSFYPVCSSKCEFMVIYNFIKKQAYSDEELSEMQSFVEKKQEIKEFSRQNAIFSISKYYTKLGLANIKFILSVGQTNVQLDKSLSNETLDMTSVCMKYTQCPKSCPSLVHETENSLVQSFEKKGGLKKWF